MGWSAMKSFEHTNSIGKFELNKCTDYLAVCVTTNIARKESEEEGRKRAFISYTCNKCTYRCGFIYF